MCPPVPPVENGFYQDLGSIGYIGYSCKEGYKLKGSERVRCIDNSGNRAWRDAAPHCERKFKRTANDYHRDDLGVSSCVDGLFLEKGVSTFGWFS